MVVQETVKQQDWGRVLGGLDPFSPLPRLCPNPAAVGSATEKVIASLRRELDNMEVEAEAAKAKAAEESSRREEIQTEVDTLRCVLAFWAVRTVSVSYRVLRGVDCARWFMCSPR